MDPRPNLPNPCPNAWTHMTPKGNGRQCRGCDQLVVDFTGMSNEAIRDTLLQHPNTCGHFTTDQLSSDPLASKSWGYLLKFAAAAAVALLGFQMTPLAQSTAPENPVKYTEQVCPVEDSPGEKHKKLTAKERRMKRRWRRRVKRGVRGKVMIGCPSF